VESPWVEEILRLEGAQTVDRWVHLSKGVHVALRIEQLPLRNMFMLELDDGRPIFVIPRGPLVYVGTTDTPYADGPARWPTVEAEDVDYLLRPLSSFFAIGAPKPQDVVASWAGLRPLIAQPNRSSSQLSRRDEVRIGPAGIVSIAGGKLTGYRPMAHAALLKVQEVLGLERRLADDSAPLPGGDFQGGLASLERKVDPEGMLGERARARLVRLYGCETEQVLARGAERLPGVEGAFAGEVDWAVQMEGALHAEDVIYRRTRLGIYDPRAREAVRAVAIRMASLLDWSPQRTEREIAQVEERLACDRSALRSERDR
jgi:glycerol-3-phosphate dehydrogenase